MAASRRSWLAATRANAGRIGLWSGAVVTIFVGVWLYSFSALLAVARVVEGAAGILLRPFRIVEGIERLFGWW